MSFNSCFFVFSRAVETLPRDSQSWAYRKREFQAGSYWLEFGFTPLGGRKKKKGAPSCRSCSRTCIVASIAANRRSHPLFTCRHAFAHVLSEKINLTLAPFRSRLQLPSILAEVSRAISSVSRVTKRQGCSGLKDLASILGPSLGEAKSGRRLIRRVLSQVPGRTWEGKEELLEAVVALCAASKGSAVTLDPFVWGGGGDAEGGPPSSPSSRGVKRSRSSDPLMGEEEEEEEGEEEDQKGDASRGVATEDNGPGASASASAGAEDVAAGDGGTASDGNDAANGVDGEDGAGFEYEDKLGDLDSDAPAGASTAEGAAPGVAGRAQKSEHPSAVGGGAPKDATLEAGLASLDMEDDSPIDFGEVATLMLSQVRR